jgi:eukaryotic-like serine/threonine-protein kinase
MGTVYEAVDDAGDAVAVKTLTAHLSDDVSLRRRFEAEIEVLKSLRHPGIVRLLAFGEEESRPFYVMELVRGRSLEDLLKDGRRFDWRETIDVATQITRALKAAHDRGIVHRDLKPANLLFPEAGADDGRVKLADFGIARLFGDAGHTQAGMVVGTAEYMAPEQASGDPVDLRADLYALGLVMFAMLVGRSPFRGGSVSEILRRQREETPPRVSVIVPEVPESLDRLIEKLLTKDPAARPASALAVGRSLALIEADPSAADTGRPSTPATPTVASGPIRPTAEAAPRSDIDLLAATRGDIPAERGTGLTGQGGQAVTQPFSASTAGGSPSLAHRLTEPDSAGAAGSASSAGNRFTTVEDLHREAAAEARQTAWRDGLAQAAIATALLGFVLIVGYAVLKPATADQIHDRIQAITADPAADLRDARPLIDLFLNRFSADPRVAAVRDLDRKLDLDALERRARRRPRAAEILSPIERDYRAAMDRKAESPLACLAALEAILALYGGPAGEPAASSASPPPPGEPAAEDDTELWLDLVRRQIEQVAPLAAREREEDSARAAATLAEAESLAVAAARASTPGERDELLARRLELLRGIVEIYGNRPHVADIVAETSGLLGDRDPAPPDSSPENTPAPPSAEP